MNIFNNLDPERLIASVKPRRALYDRHDKLFHRHRLKKDIWFEVCGELNRNFSRMSQLQKVEYSREIQKRWKNLRTCFTRELCLQKKEQLARQKNLNVNKRKRYEYYRQLIFLKDCVEGPEDCDNRNDGDRESVNSDTTCIEEMPVEYSETKSEVLSDVLEQIDRNGDKESCRSQHYETNMKERLLDIIKDEYEDDDDRQFVLSLVPMFKELDRNKKLEARIDVMKVLQELVVEDG